MWSCQSYNTKKIQNSITVNSVPLRLIEVHKMMIEEEEDKAKSAGLCRLPVKSDRSKQQPTDFTDEAGPSDTE